MNVELYKIVVTIAVLLAFVAASYLVDALRHRHLDRVEVAWIVGVLLCVVVITMLVWANYSNRMV